MLIIMAKYFKKIDCLEIAGYFCLITPVIIFASIDHRVVGLHFSILYLEGNLETKIFNDPITGLTRRVREVAVRRDGRVVFLQTGSDGQEPQQAELKGVGYY
ncbi:single-stranded DNA-binding protein, mitochondrial [Tanacetum coccineum]